MIIDGIPANSHLTYVKDENYLFRNSDKINKSENEEEAMLAALTAVLLLQKEKTAVANVAQTESTSNWKKNRKNYI